MMSTPINVATRSKYYQTPTPTIRKEKEATPSSSALSFGPLHIKRPNPNSAIQPRSRGLLRNSSYNSKTRATQHYTIIEDLAQVPSAMSSLKVLHCGLQWEMSPFLNFQ